MDVFGKVLLDTLDSDFAVYYAIERDDNFLGISNAQSYFMDFESFPEHEQELLEKVEGDVLELAAGAGRISLYLQEKGYKTLTTDISEGAVEVCKERGIMYTKKFDFTKTN